MQNAPFLLKFSAALLTVAVIGLVLWVVTALHIYVLGWLLGVIGLLF